MKHSPRIFEIIVRDDFLRGISTFDFRNIIEYRNNHFSVSDDNMYSITLIVVLVTLLALEYYLRNNNMQKC